MSRRDINININLGPDEPEMSSEDSKVSKSCNKLIEKIKKCYDWQTFYELKSEFHKIGLSIEKTGEDRFILCRMEEGSPIYESIIDDYIFVGSISQIREEIRARNLDIIVDFVETNAGVAQTRDKPKSKDYNKNVDLYGQAIRINEEAELCESQEISFISRRMPLME